LNGANGIIQSPNYPVQVYPDLSDCRWSITVKPGAKVRLLFAYFKTQAEMDFLYVRHFLKLADMSKKVSNILLNIYRCTMGPVFIQNYYLKNQD
jgi:hypothetical protein